MKFLVAVLIVALHFEAAAAVPEAGEFRKNLKDRTDAKGAAKSAGNKAPKPSSCDLR
jgi:hypothetical protein